MIPLLQFVDFALQTLFSIYWWIIFASVIMSWLIAFNVINPYNQFVRTIWNAVNRLTEPLLQPIRRMMPDLGGLDVSPIVLLVACMLLEYFLRNVVIRGWLMPLLAG